MQKHYIDIAVIKNLFGLTVTCYAVSLIISNGKYLQALTK